jgi:hypothetical protein
MLRPVALAIVLTACVGPDEEASLRPNHAPQAALRVPIIAPVGAAVTIDAGASLDADGELLTYVFSFTPGGEIVSSTDPIIHHAFTQRGVHSVMVRVIDARGGESAASQDISVRDSIPEPPDFCATADDCVVGDECDAGVCYVTGGMIE